MACPPFATVALGASRIAAHVIPFPDRYRADARELGASLIYVPSMRNGSSADDPAENRGNAILSTLPVSEPIADRAARRAPAESCHFREGGAGSFGRFIHLDALGGGALRLFWTPWMRDVQVRSTRRLPEGPLVIGADLNTWHGRDELAARFMGDVFRATPLSMDRPGIGTARPRLHVLSTGRERRARYRQAEHVRIGSSATGRWVEWSFRFEDWKIGDC